MIPDQVYKIDAAQLNSLQRRILLKQLKIFIWIFPLIVIFQYWAKHNLTEAIAGGAFFVLFFAIYTYFSTSKKLKKFYKSFQIILNDTEVGAQADTMAYRYIAWENLIVDRNLSGAIHLYDKNISPFKRRMFGKGWIIVQPELLNIDMLLSQLTKHQQLQA